MTVGVEPCQADLFKGSAFVRERLAAESVFAVLEREGRRLFPEAMFDDLFSSRGRRSVPPRVVACVMVLQRWFGLSDREAVAAFEFDLRWRFACGGLDVDGGGFCHTVLVGMRARLAASEQPRRIFDAVLVAARQAGALSQRRVLDSVPIYDAVATQDTATMLHRAIRAVLAAASDAALGVDAALRGDYASGARARCDWDDPRARQELVDRLGADAAAVLAALEGRELDGALSEAAELLAAVAGQDLCQDRGGRFMIARRVAKDRVLSTVDPDARHGHKSTARRFDGYKGHTAVDPDSELITATAVTPANTADAQPAPELINDLLNTADTAEDSGTADTAGSDTADTAEDSGTADTADSAAGPPTPPRTLAPPTPPRTPTPPTPPRTLAPPTPPRTLAPPTPPRTLAPPTPPRTPTPPRAPTRRHRRGRRGCGGVRGQAHGLWRQRVRQRRVPGAASAEPHQLEVPHPACGRAGGPLHQGPLRRRFAQRHRHLPRRHDRRHQSPRRRLGHGRVRRGLPRVRAARRLHRRRRGPHRAHQRQRGRARRVARPPAGPRMAKRLPRRAPQSRTQARAPRAPKTRWSPRPRARPGQSRRRLQPAGRSRQHRAPRRARTALDTTAMGPRLSP